MSEENKEVVRRFLHELWNTGKIDAIDELMDAGCDGDISYSISADFPFSAEDAFSAARSPSYGDSGMAARMEEFSQSHPDLAKVIRKGMILRSEGNFRGVKKRAQENFAILFRTFGVQSTRWLRNKTWSGYDGPFEERCKATCRALASHYPENQ